MFTVQGAARPQGSKRHVGRGVMVESSKHLRPWRQDVREAAWLEMERPTDGTPGPRTPFPGPVHVDLTFCYRRGVSHYRADGVTLNAAGLRKPYPTRPDTDKLARAILDSITGVVIVDDRQVVELTARRVWGPRDETHVAVEEVE